MKKVLCTLLILSPCASFGAGDMDVKYTWSYGALADTMKAMRNDCELTHADEFMEMGNWFRAKGARFSMNEFINQCKSQNHSFHEIDRKYKTKDGKLKKCVMPTTSCTEQSCGEKAYTNNKGCNIFLSTFIKNNNLRKSIQASNKPGTYVKKINLKSGKTAYQIVDVVLAPGYWKNNKIDNTVNNNPANTKIYDISSGTIKDTGLSTWTNDMFLDVSAARYERGDVRGAFVNSYIRPDINLTKEIYSMYDSRRGQMTNTTGNTKDSASFDKKILGVKIEYTGDFDVKAKYAPKYKISPQSDVESQTNGVMFNGKIAHLDWLGHFLYGMNRQESIGPNWGANAAAQTVSFINGGKFEPLNMQNAWNLGSDLVKENDKKINKTFKDVQTKTEQEAYNKAAAQMKKIYSDAGKVSCTGNCNKRAGTRDIVICTDSKGRRIEFEFDDICDTKFFWE